MEGRVGTDHWHNMIGAHPTYMHTIKTISRYLLAILFIIAGANHFVDPAFYESIMPPYLPAPFTLVVASGIAEIVLGSGLFVPKYRRLSAWGLILLLIAVFPANIHMATHPNLYPTISTTLLWLRLPLQGVLIAWAYWYTRADHSV